jgi:sulfatase maturation enzyme AslB (radical SAM superfamily)
MSFTVSINPSYFCNFTCKFCYLTESQLRDKTKINLDKLDELLSEIPRVDKIDLYGGEVTALPNSYFYGLKEVIRKHYSGKININTNFSKIYQPFFDDDITLSVSYDFHAREKHEEVFNNMLMSEVPIAVLVLASEEVVQMDVDSMINQLNMCSAITSVEIKPYSINQSNQQKVTHKQFEDFVIKWLESPIEKKFEFINEYRIEDSLSKTYSAFSSDHVYITPNGKFAVLEFDLYDREYFLELDSFQEYLNWAKLESYTNISDICRNCKYYGNCLTEHYRFVEDLENSCSGYKGLLEYYERMEN